MKLFACVCETDACCHGNKQSHKFSALEIRKKSRLKDTDLGKVDIGDYSGINLVCLENIISALTSFFKSKITIK